MKVSVIVRTCNRPEFLKEALVSVFLQSYPNWEVLIFDDGANLENFKIFNDFKMLAGDRRVIYLTTKSEYDLFRNSWLMAPDIVSGELMVRLDDDDILDSKALEWLVDVYTKNPELDFSYGSSATFNGDTLGDVIQTNNPFEHPKTHHEWAAYTIPNNKPWKEPWAFYRDYYKEARHLTSIIHCAKDNMFCVFHTYVMRTESVKKVKDRITVTSKFVDDLEFFGSLDYMGLGHTSLKKILTFVRVHDKGRVSDFGRVVDNTNIVQENFHIRDKVDELRPSGFISRIIPLDVKDNFNMGIDESLKENFIKLRESIQKVIL
jgi:glycosyltransferase involved in cell wall biosynthesis